jgi:hypothetical protein
MLPNQPWQQLLLLLCCLILRHTHQQLYAAWHCHQVQDGMLSWLLCCCCGSDVASHTVLQGCCCCWSEGCGHLEDRKAAPAQHKNSSDHNSNYRRWAMKNSQHTGGTNGSALLMPTQHNRLMLMAPQQDVQSALLHCSVGS